MKKFYNIFKNAVVTKTYAEARTMEADPLMGFMFKVKIDGKDCVIGFQKIAGLSKEIAVIDYFENMYQFAHKLPGRESVGEVTFEKGMFADKVFSGYYENLFSSHNRYNIDVIICDRFGNEKKIYSFNDCWFSKYEVSDLDASSDDVLIETLTMQSEGMTHSLASI